MTIRLIRVFFLVLSAVCGYYLGSLFTDIANSAWIGLVAGTITGLLIILLEVKLKSVSLRNLSAAAFGLIFGFFMAWMVTLILRLIPMPEDVYPIAQIIFTLIFCYLGMIISIKGKDEFNVVIPYVRFTREDQSDQLFLLDTSVIIDGRIASVCETGFISGRLVVPRFVLHELQQVADSSDDSVRTRGRRGLDMLEKLKKVPGTEVIIHDEGLPDIKEVDAKLVRMAKVLDCPVLTNDFNLNKVAKLEGVMVLNINDLASSLRPVVLPGEKMNVFIKKEGKERDQGVAFMDDGTMIVVDNARRFIGRNVNVAVTSILQTSAGRMIFANLMEKADQGKQNRSQKGQGRGGNKKHGNGQKKNETSSPDEKKGNG
ncbi:MAG: TRAM domain-containing protein [Candidatus Omnitrophica bacterium]|nr:TRAM domain-containing protein [Candidatus Omnitrophota bacterium]